MFLISLTFFSFFWVVSRETGSIYVLDKGLNIIKVIETDVNSTHASLKFRGGNTYILSRDGFLLKVVLNTGKRTPKIQKIKVGESSISFDFLGDTLVVANYKPKTLVVVEDKKEGMKIKRKIRFSSRPVSVKSYKGKQAVFLLIDERKVGILKWEKSRNDWIYKLYPLPSPPFDAMLYKDKYIIGFFKGVFLGVFDLMQKTLSLYEIQGSQNVFKIPHFGLWSVAKGKAYIPVMGKKSVIELDLSTMKITREFSTIGKPVFVVSDGKGKIAVNYSGEKEDFISLIDTISGQRKDIKAGKRIMHLKFVGNSIVVSSYFENKVKIIGIDGKVKKEVFVPTPSGIFKE